MLGGFLALLSAASFGLNNAIARRGVLTGTVAQAMAISIPIGLAIFIACVIVLNAWPVLLGFSWEAYALLALTGVVHFVGARYCTYRALKAMGGNLAGPVQQLGLILTLVLAVAVLGETLTMTKLTGIGLVVFGPMLMLVRSGAGRARPPKASPNPEFKPDYREGYIFAALSAIGAGVSPIFIRLAVPEGAGLTAGIAAGTISYLAAAIVIGLILALPGRYRHVRAMEGANARLFVAAAILVNFSQVFRYMALAIAPVSVVTPIQRTTIIFRMIFAKMINPEHERFDGRMILATVISLAGALLLTVNVEGLF